MIHLRDRYLLAMGLAVSGCQESDAPAPTTATVSLPPPSATPSATATAAATATPTATATATATVAMTPTAPPPPRGLSNVPHFTAEYPHQNGRGCSTAEAHCYLLQDLQHFASVGSTCPHTEDVPQGCMGGAICRDPDARTTGALLPAVTRQQTTAKHAAACCYEVPDLCCAACGRTLRDGDRVVVTARASRADWCDVREGTTRDRSKGARFAAMAAAEHASIASFARTTLDLLALGAPADLVEGTQRAALDEIAHARAAYALASELLGEPVGPAPLVAPHEPATLASFVASTFLDACVAESLGADDLRAMASVEPDAPIAAALERMASDEERHVELAFRMLAWAVRAGGSGARARLASAIDSLDVRSRERAVVAAVVLPCARALLSA